ncbi:MAG: hypothetical protein FJ387_23520 [Verrucomicrobia bacterium]|nr:hypothetical protein [Verrucomicrobiota bacterium]
MKNEPIDTAQAHATPGPAQPAVALARATLIARVHRRPSRHVALSLLLLWAGWAGVGRATEAGGPDPFVGAPIFELGEIPFQTVWHGQETRFRVRATALGAGTVVTAGYAAPPSGTIGFEAGRFYYRPGPADKAEFTVTFRAVGGDGRRLEQIVPIQPIPLLPPESELLGVERLGVPDPASRDYLAITDLKAATATPFNHAQRPTRVVTIAGKEVVIRKGHANRLYESYHGNEDIREFYVRAETLIVGSPFRLPSTRLVIQARRLEFQDFDREASHLSTEPPAYPSSAASASGNDTKGRDGSPGLKGGDMEVYAEVVELVGTYGRPVPRFILNGGRGQNGGPGRTGNAGVSRTVIDAKQLTGLSAANQARTTALVLPDDNGFLWLDTDYDVYFGKWTLVKNDYDSLNGAKSYLTSNSGWRAGDGNPAIADGVPGAGGAAGRLQSNIDFAPFGDGWLEARGGAPGTAGSQKGGAPGSPVTAQAYLRTVKTISPLAFTYELLQTHTAKAGKDASAPTANPGSATPTASDPGLFSWYSAPALRQIVNQAKDTYLAGELEYVQALCADYLALLEEYRTGPEWAGVPADAQRDFALLEEELRLIAHRLATGLDYFGNPPGWVPLLSLEANKLAFEDEIGRAIGILYLEYWLSQVGTTLQAKLGALGDARVKLASESEKLARDFEAANNLLPQLDGRVAAIDQESAAIQNDLKLLEADLLRRAEANAKGPLWRRVARGLATVAKMVPVPWVQAVGVGLDLAANFDPKNPLDTVNGIKDVVATYRAGGFDKTAKNLNDTYKKTKFPDLPSSADPKTIKGFVDDLQKSAQPLVGKFKEVQQAMEGTQAPKGQIEAELAKLKAESKEFKRLGDRISELMSEKELFVQQVAQTMQLLGGLSQNITGNLLAMDAFNEGYAQAAGALDDRALMYLREIGRRARERLLLYHYYVKKAYEYRLLKPYPGRLDLQKMFDRFRAIAEQSAGTYRPLTAAEFRDLRGLYDDALGELVKEVVVEYNRNAPSLSAPRRLPLTPDELERLNRGESVSLNLRTVGGTGLFPSSEENLRIANVRVLHLAVEPTANPQDGEEVSLYVEHGGISTLQTSTGNRPRQYHFLHYTHGTEIPVQWGARFFPKRGDLIPITRSLSADSLLGALLQKSGTDPRQAGYFTYLGGLAELHLTREQTAAAGVHLRLKEVLLEIEYEFVRRPNTLRTLEFTVADGLGPYVEVSTPDLAGRQDGLGVFSRTYAAGRQVTLSVPHRMGNLRFAGFVDLSQGGSRVALHNAPVTIHRGPAPAGLPMPATFDGSTHTLTINLHNDRRVEARYVALEDLRLSLASGPDRGTLELELDGPRYTPYRLEEGPTVRGPWETLQQGVLMAPTALSLPGPTAPQRFFRLGPE